MEGLTNDTISYIGLWNAARVAHDLRRESEAAAETAVTLMSLVESLAELNAPKAHGGGVAYQDGEGGETDHLIEQAIDASSRAWHAFNQVKLIQDKADTMEFDHDLESPEGIKAKQPALDWIYYSHEMAFEAQSRASGACGQ